MSPGESRMYSPHELGRDVLLGLDLYCSTYTDPARHILTAGWDQDDLARDLSDVCSLLFIGRTCNRKTSTQYSSTGSSIEPVCGRQPYRHNPVAIGTTIDTHTVTLVDPIGAKRFHWHY